MTLTDRERFIMHTMKLMASKGFLENLNEAHGAMELFVNLLIENRCRKLEQDDVDVIFKDVEEELLLSKEFYRENNI